MYVYNTVSYAYVRPLHFISLKLF